MASLNKVMVIGNCGKDPEMKFTPNGKPVTTFSIACNSKYGDQEHTEWFSIVAWNKLAELCHQYLTKGQQVYVEGRLQTRSWESDDGGKHYRTEVIADKALFLGPRREQAENDEEVPF